MSHNHFRSGRQPPAALRRGDVFTLPEGATWLNRDKPRPYVLITDCEPPADGFLAYGSTRETERAAGAAFVLVAPRPVGINANGLRATTFFYPGMMLPIDQDLLPNRIGTLGAARPELRRALRQALGIGTGTCMDSAAPAGSRRGRIVVLDPDLASVVQTAFAVILTEHRYSREARYQVIVPIMGGDDVHEESLVLRVARRSWFGIFSMPISSAWFAVPVIQSVWHRTDIAAETAFVIDDDALTALEALLCTVFDLDPPE